MFYIGVKRLLSRHACLHAWACFRRLRFLFWGFVVKSSYSGRKEGSGLKNGKIGTLGLFFVLVTLVLLLVDTLLLLVEGHLCCSLHSFVYEIGYLWDTFLSCCETILLCRVVSFVS